MLHLLYHANCADGFAAAGIEKLKPTAPPTVEERLSKVEYGINLVMETLSMVVLTIQKNALEGRLLMTAAELQKLIGIDPPSPPFTVSEPPSLPTLPGLETPPLPVSGAAVS